MGGLVILAIGASFWTGINPSPTDIALKQQQSVLDAQRREASNEFRNAEQRAPEALERLKVAGCTIMVLVDQPWISPALTEGQPAWASDGILMQSGFVCTTTHTAKVVNGQVTDVIPVPPADVAEYLELFNILSEAKAQRFQTIYGN